MKLGQAAMAANVSLCNTLRGPTYIEILIQNCEALLEIVVPVEEDARVAVGWKAINLWEILLFNWSLSPLWKFMKGVGDLMDDTFASASTDPNRWLQRKFGMYKMMQRRYHGHDKDYYSSL